MFSVPRRLPLSAVVPALAVASALVLSLGFSTMAWAEKGKDTRTPGGAGEVKDIDDGFAEVELLTRVLETVRENYVDPDKVTYARLMASALRGMLADLDPHSQFLTPEVYEQFKLETESTYEGVGITIAPQPGNLTIVSVREDGPAARAGVMPGDVITKLGEHLTEKLSYLECVNLLRGNPGETLTFTISRPATKETKEFSMIREVMRQETVRDVMLLDPALTGGAKVGYLRLLQFNEPSAQELADALDKLEDNGMTAFILDLRNNPGGLLKTAVEVLGEFLPPGTVVVTTEGRPGAKNPPPLRTPPRQRRVRGFPMAVLVNRNSASASELVSGALQDLGRATVVGAVTYGKGSVQNIIPSGNGTAIRLTIAHYFTPSHKLIHGKGITPDIAVSQTPEEEKRIFEYFRDHSATHPDPAAMAKLGDKPLESAVAAVLKPAAPKTSDGKDVKDQKEADSSGSGGAGKSKPAATPGR